MHTAALFTQFLQSSYRVNNFGLELIDRTCVYESVFLLVMDTLGINDLNFPPDLVVNMHNQQVDLEKYTSQMFFVENWIKELEAEVKNYKDQVANLESRFKATCDRNVKHQTRALDEEYRANKAEKLAAEYLKSYEMIVE